MSFLHTFCGEPFYVWNESKMGKCFRNLCLISPTYVLFVVISAFYLGKRQGFQIRPNSRVSLINTRLFICVLLCLIPFIQLIYMHFVERKVFIVDYTVTFIAVLTWIIHTLYLMLVKRTVLTHVAESISVAFCFVLCFVSFAINLYFTFNNNEREYSKAFNAVIVTIFLFYFVILLLNGVQHKVILDDLWSVNTSEHESNLSGYHQFHDETDPTDLGTAEESVGIISRLFFFWVQPLMIKGSKNNLQSVNDLHDLPLALQAHSVFDKVSTKIYTPDGATPSLVREFHKHFGCEYYSIGILKFLSDCLAFGGPLLLNALVTFLESKNDNKDFKFGCYYALGLFAITFIGALCSTHYNYLINRISLKIRASLVTMIYQKTLIVSKRTLSLFNSGEILNFISTDTDRIVNFCQSFHQFWSLPLQIVITLYFLYVQVGYSFLVGLAFAIIIIPINQYIAKKIGNYSSCMMKEKDSRIKIMNEILSGIRVIKMQTWEKLFCKKVETIRHRELLFLKKRKYLDAMCVFFWATTPTLISFLTFTTYVALGNVLTAAKVFTSIALFNILIMPLNAFPWVLNGLVEAWISVKRVDRFLQLPYLDELQYYSETDNPDLKVEIVDGTFNYEKENHVEDILKDEVLSNLQDFCLGPFNLKVMKGNLICVIGKVGSGKSSLLSSVLADLNCIFGQVKLSISDRNKGVGYVPQEPWIQQASIRENILFGKSLNTLKYRNVLEACGLFEDLKAFPHGDKTEAGEKGFALSGGQKARIALARAVYQDFDIYLLDDPLASIDAHVAEHIFSNCIMGVLKHKTRILCTHKTHFVEKADLVIILSEGKIVSQGTPNQILPFYCVKDVITDSGEFKEIKETRDVTDKNVLEEGEIDIAVPEEEKDEGVVKFHVYKAYWMAIGSQLSIAVLVFCFLMQASKSLSDWWLSFWVSDLAANGTDYSGSYQQNLHRYFLLTGKESVTFYLSVYGGIAFASSTFTAFRAFLFAYAGIKAAVELHNRLLSSIIKAASGFFDVTPLGRILNRFSSDLFCIDDSLPFALNIFLAQAYSLFGCLVVTCYGLPWIILLLVPLSVMYFKIQQYYRCTSRELKRLSSISLSPIYAHFSETLNGHSVIRAMSSSSRFMEDNMGKVDSNQRATFATAIASQWLNLRLQFIGVAVVSGVAFIAIIQSKFGYVDPGLIGLALSYALSITSLLNGAITAFTETEKEIVSVERVMQYVDGVKPEIDGDSQMPPFAWPSYGVITFQNVSLQYRPDSQYALENVSFETKPSEKIGIVGRTGSGKSSLIQVLFRMINVNCGSVLIDGVNIRDMKLQYLRSNLAVIPQDPFLFSGTIRDNLDPYHIRSDAEILKALGNCHMKEKVLSLGGLDTEVDEQGRNYSTGERQLLCLSRTLLQKVKILCMDEATANIDHHTDSLIRHTIRMAFRHTTVLIIAHRTETVMDCDRVIVMGQGRLLEMDRPSMLLSNPESEFYKLVYGVAT